MSEDHDNLAQYVQQGSQEAFRELVRRHVDLVYSAALRQVGDVHLAEDVVQAAFLVLARKAPTIRQRTALAGWLLTVARYASVDAMRQRRRRVHHERAAARPEAIETAAATWERASPMLDEAMARLSAKDRDAVVLRFFKDRSFAEVGQALGISEEASRKRVTRAMDKLRKLLAGRGVTLGAGALAAAVAARAVQAAPAGLAVACAGEAAGVGAAATALAEGAIKMMAWAKMKMMAIGVAAVVFAGAMPPLAVGISRAMAQTPAGAALPGTAPQATAPAVSGPAAGGPGLNITAPGVFLNERTIWAWQVRLSPDGRTMLYRRPTGGKETVDPGDSGVTYELVLRQVDDGKEAVLPTGPIPNGYDSVYTRFNCFDATGQTLAMARFAQGGMELVLYDMATGAVKETGIRDRQVMAKFDRTGKGLVVALGRSIALASLADFKLKPLAAPGYLQSLCPAADVAAVYAAGRPDPANPRRRPTERLVLYDLAADKEIRDLPVHERNSQLDDLETQWTPDGQYLYYVDMRDNPADAKAPIAVARAWDRINDKEAAVIDRAVPVGPGPNAQSMILRRQQGDSFDIILHDARTGQMTVLVPAPATLEHAWGSRIAYSTKSPEGKLVLHVMDVSVP